MPKQYWLEHGETIQGDAGRGNMKGMYNDIMKAYGPGEHKTAPMKAKDGTLLTDKQDQMRR